MREIKFRAWFRDIPFMETDIAIGDGYRQMVDTNNEEWCREVGQADAIMQFTGLKDKNGKDIYEGDIIRIDDIAHRIYSVEIGKGEMDSGVYDYYGVHLVDNEGNDSNESNIFTFAKEGRI